MFFTSSDLLFPLAEPTPDFLQVRPFLLEDRRATVQLEREIIPWLPAINEQQPSKSRKIHAQSALKSAESLLRRGPSTGTQGIGHDNSIRAEIERQARHLVEWATVTGRLIDPSLARRTDFEIGGVEHDVFHDDATGRWLKITKAGKFGKAHYVHGEEVLGVPSAFVLDDGLPMVYLERLRLANTNFGDNLCLHGVIASGGEPRVVISQRHVPGESATPDQIARYFKDNGFTQVMENSFYNSRENLLVSDAHSGNMLRTVEGIIVAIDVIIQRPEGKLLRAVTPRGVLSFDDESEPTLIRS